MHGSVRADLYHVGADPVVGLPVHVGSGITEEATWPPLADVLAPLASDFPDVHTINVGGGLGVPNRRGTAPLDVDALDAALGEAAGRHTPYELWLEPGRYLVAEVGVLLARVTQTKAKGPVRYVDLDTGMNSLLRPVLYGAYHEIVNLTRLGEHEKSVHPACPCRGGSAFPPPENTPPRGSPSASPDRAGRSRSASSTFCVSHTQHLLSYDHPFTHRPVRPRSHRTGDGPHRFGEGNHRLNDARRRHRH